MELQRVESPSSTALKSLEDWRALVGRALGRIGWSQKRAAIEIGIPETQFSRQLAGTENLSFWKMRTLPPEFWRELIVLVCEFHDITIGQSTQERIDAENGKLLRELMARTK